MSRAVVALLSVVVLAGGLLAPSSAFVDMDGGTTTHTVTGSGVHFFTTSMIHTQEPTDTGMIQTSTDIVELSGDLKGRVLYHPTSIFDFVNGTLVNTGNQVFSGTILDSAPVMIHDDKFRFEVNFNTGSEFGEVHLTDRLAGPRIRCDLIVTGNGTMTPEGNPVVDYAGTCTFKK
jgi:hypothetical protein